MADEYMPPSRRHAIYLDLAAAAERAERGDTEPATRKQIGFLASLLARSGADASCVDCDGPDTTLSKASAMAYIAMLAPTRTGSSPNIVSVTQPCDECP